MDDGISRGSCVSLVVLLVALVLAARVGIYAQVEGSQSWWTQQRLDATGHATPGNVDVAVDLTGTWVSVITAEWHYRMVTPRRGDLNFPGMELTDEAVRMANTWDPAADEAAGEECKGYGAIGGTRLPGKVRFSWQDENTLKMELEAGNQIRLFHFFGAEQRPAREPTWQGFSAAEWQYAAVTAPGQPRDGNLKVVTALMRPGYSRKNGVPYSKNAELTEYFHVNRDPNGDQWLVLISHLRDFQYYWQPAIATAHFKKIPDDSSWSPEPCSAR